MSYYCMKNGLECSFANLNGHCTITACTRTGELMSESYRLKFSTNTLNKNLTRISKDADIAVKENFYDQTPLESSKTPEDEYNDQQKISLAENYLESLGIKVRTDMYGFYRNTYDILKDLGEYLSNNKNDELKLFENNTQLTRSTIQKLAYYEDLKARGRLVILEKKDDHPCRDCDVGWGSADGSGCRDTCIRFKEYIEKCNNKN